MSDGHDHEHEHDDAADEHHDHGFDGEPAKELGPDEPQTPGWVPLVGAAVFVAGAVFFLVARGASPPAASGEMGAQGAAQTVAKPQEPRPTQPIQAQPRPMPGPPGLPQPAGSDGPKVQKLSPDQVKDLQKRIQDARQKQQEAGGAKGR